MLAPTTFFPSLVFFFYKSERRLQGTELPDSITELLRQPMTVSETMQEEEIKILTPLFLITDSRLWVLIFYKPLNSSLRWGHCSWGMSLLCSPLQLLRIKVTFLFPPNSVSVFFIQLQWAEKAKILTSNKGTFSVFFFSKPQSKMAWSLKVHISSRKKRFLKKRFLFDQRSRKWRPYEMVSGRTFCSCF